MKNFISKMKVDKSQSGQTLMIVLLVMIAGLTVGLYLMSRTTTDISMTTKSTDSSRAFNAAEAGIEAAIKDISVANGTVQTIGTNANFKPTAADLGHSSTFYPATKQADTALGQAFTVWLVGHDDAGLGLIPDDKYLGTTIGVCFASTSPNPAIAINLIYSDGAVTKSSYAAYDSYAARIGTNNFKQASDAGPNCPDGYNYFADVDLKNDFNLSSFDYLIALRIRPIYVTSSIAVNPYGHILPKQGNDISSVGTAGDTTRKIDVKDPYLAVPSFMDYAVYSYGGIQ